MENENGPTPSVRKNGAWAWLNEQLRASVFNLSFWLGLTLGFPLEHFLWEYVWPFKLITKWFGL